MAKFWQAVFLLIATWLVLPECWAGRSGNKTQPKVSADVPPARRPITRSTELPEGYLKDIFQTQQSTGDIKKYLQARTQFLAQLDLELVSTTADGSCQFDALGKQLSPSVSGHRLRNDLLDAVMQVEKRHKSGNYESTREQNFWGHFRSVLYPEKITTLKNEFQNPRIWFDSLSLAPLAAFLLKRPVIHFRPSHKDPWYEIQAINNDGEILDEGQWQTLLPLEPLFLINNGNGHYEGALPIVTGKISVYPGPVEFVLDSDFEDVLFLSVPEEDLDLSPVPESRKEPVSLKQDGLDDVSPIALEHSDAVPNIAFSPANLNDWVEPVKPVPKTYQELAELVGTYNLQMGHSGIPEIAGGFYGALVLAFYRYGRMDKPTLHDVKFLNETRMLLERFQYQPLLGPIINEALSFCRPPSAAPGSHILQQALLETNDVLTPFWQKKCLLTALSSLHNAPLLIMHPYAREGRALLYKPWQPVVEVPNDQLSAVIENMRPAVLVHNGGYGESARWKTVIYPSSSFGRFKHKSLFQPVDADEVPPVAHQAYAMSMVLVPLVLKLSTVAQKNFKALPMGLLPKEHNDYLETCLSLRGQPSIDQINETREKTRKMAKLQTGDEWLTVWRILEAYSLKKKNLYRQADRILRNLAETDSTPQYLRRYILDMRAFTTYFDEKQPTQALNILNQYQEMTRRSRRLLLLQAGALREVQVNLEKNISILQALYESNPYDLDVTLSLAILYSKTKRDRDAITLLSQIPGNRDIHEAVRVLASSYSHNGQIREALNLIQPLCSTFADEKGHECAAKYPGRCPQHRNTQRELATYCAY